MKLTNDRFIKKRQEKDIDGILLEYKNKFNSKKLNKRYISNSPDQVLDAPGLNICNFIIIYLSSQCRRIVPALLIMSFTTSPPIIKPAAAGTQALLAGIVLLSVHFLISLFGHMQ